MMDQSPQTGNTNEAAQAAAPAVTPGEATSQAFNFFFKTDKVRDDEGKVIGNGRKHPDVKAVLPIPTYASLATALGAGGKQAALVLESVVDVIYTAARQQINEWRETNGLDKDFTATNFDLNKLSLEAVANTPRSERGGAAISEEDWTGFLEDYAQVMEHTVGYEAKKVKLAVLHFKVRLARIRNDKAAVQKLLDLLNLWATNTQALEDHTACYEDLTKRAKKYLEAEEKDVAAAL